MFISVLELFKLGIGPSSSHTLGPMVAARNFLTKIDKYITEQHGDNSHRIRCILRGSLAFTGKGHATDRAITLGLHGYSAEELAGKDVDSLINNLWQKNSLSLKGTRKAAFTATKDILFDKGEPLPEHPNGMIFQLWGAKNELVYTETYFSIGGGFVSTQEEITQVVAPLRMKSAIPFPYPFDSAQSMLRMAEESGLTIAEMKRENELALLPAEKLEQGLSRTWQAMKSCVETGLSSSGTLPGKLNVTRRAGDLFRQLQNNPAGSSVNDWLCAYAMAVNEENASGNMVVTAPTNGAAGVIPAVLYYLLLHENGTAEQVNDFLLTAAAIGGIIKHRSSISGAEVGCQGEVGSAASMAAAGLCAVRGGTPQQIENAAEIALEHHLGMTCDPVGGLVQVPCIERNGFGAIKAYTAASLAMRGSGDHFMPLDSCIAAMKQTGLEMSRKFKETSLGGLAVSLTEC